MSGADGERVDYLSFTTILALSACGTCTSTTLWDMDSAGVAVLASWISPASLGAACLGPIRQRRRGAERHSEVLGCKNGWLKGVGQVLQKLVRRLFSGGQQGLWELLCLITRPSISILYAYFSRPFSRSYCPASQMYKNSPSLSAVVLIKIRACLIFFQFCNIS